MTKAVPILLAVALVFPAPAQRRASQPADRTFGVSVGPPRSIQFPDRHAVKLSNGLRAYWLENNELPVVTGSIGFGVGSLLDPAEKRGLAAVALRTLAAAGTRSLPGRKFRDRLDALGASVVASTEPTRSFLTFRCLREDFDELFPMLAGLLAEPVFDDDSLDFTLGALRSGVAGRNNDLSAAVAREAGRIVRGLDHPLAARVDYETLDNIGRQDIERFYAAHIHPGSAILVVEGASLDGVAGPSIEKYFGAWAPSESAPPPAPKIDVPEPPQRVLYHHDNRSLRKGLFAVAGLGGRAGDPDLAAMLLAVERIGGARGSLLADLAVKHRLWNMAWEAQWGAEYDFPGLFTINVNVEPAFTTEAIRAVLDAVEESRAEALSASAIDATKRRLLHKLATGFAARGALLTQMLTSELHGAPPESIAAILNSIRDVTPAQVKDAALRRLDTSKLAVVALGPETLYERPLAGLERLEVPLDLSIPQPKPFAPPTDPSAVARGKAMLSRMAESIGGAARLRQVNRLELRLEGRIRTGAKDPWSDRSGWERWIAPSVFRQEITGANVKMITFYDASIGWQWTAGGLYAMSAPVLKRVRGEIFRYLFRIALAGEDPKSTVSHLGANIVQVTDEEENGARIYLDDVTGRPSRITYRNLNLAGASIAVEESLSDWAEHDGIFWPSTVVIRENGLRTQEINLRSIDFNPTLKLEDLARKP
ncbi:MAG: pitrilysin family protein [Bryobacteraceae bacterium]